MTEQEYRVKVRSSFEFNFSNRCGLQHDTYTTTIRCERD